MRMICRECVLSCLENDLQQSQNCPLESTEAEHIRCNPSFQDLNGPYYSNVVAHKFLRFFGPAYCQVLGGQWISESGFTWLALKTSIIPIHPFVIHWHQFLLSWNLKTWTTRSGFCRIEVSVQPRFLRFRFVLSVGKRRIGTPFLPWWKSPTRHLGLWNFRTRRFSKSCGDVIFDTQTSLSLGIIVGETTHRNAICLKKSKESYYGWAGEGEEIASNDTSKAHFQWPKTRKVMGNVILLMDKLLGTGWFSKYPVNCNCSPLFWPYQTMKPPSVLKDTKNPTSISRTQPSHAARNLGRLVLQMSCVLLWATLECELHYVLMFGADTKTRRQVNVRLPGKTTFLGHKTCSNQCNLVGEQTPVYYSNFSSIFPVWNPTPKQQLAHHWIKASDEMLENPLTLDL